MDSDVSISTLDHPWRGSPASPRVFAAPLPLAASQGSLTRGAAWLPKIVAAAVSAALHAGLALGAMHWTFEVSLTPATTRFRQRETQVMNVRLTLAPPSPTFTESTTKLEPATASPDASQPLAPSQSPAPQPAAPQPTDFTGTPTPARPGKEQPGDAPGFSAAPKNTLATTEPVAPAVDITPMPKPDERSDDPARRPTPDPVASPPPVPVDPPKPTATPTEPSPAKPARPAVADADTPAGKSEPRAQSTSNPGAIAIARATPSSSVMPVPDSTPTPSSARTITSTTAAKTQATDAASPSPAATPGVTRGIAIVDLPEPRYPPLSIRAGEEGSVILEIEVLPDGAVGEVRVIKSPGFARLERAAIDAVKRSRFEPATRAGKPVRDRITKEFRFILKDARGR